MNAMQTRCSSIVSYSTRTPVDSLSNIQNNGDIILELSGACELSGRQLDHGPIGSIRQLCHLNQLSYFRQLGQWIQLGHVCQ